MSDVSVVDVPRAEYRARRTGSVVLATALIGATAFVAVFALHYLTLNEQVFGAFWSRRYWLLVHIGGGMIALLTGPGQLWLGLNRWRLDLHRQIGLVYITSIAVSSAAALYM